MSITEMQACLARLYTDDPFRSLFYLNQENVLNGYILTDDERNAIKAVDQSRLDYFASSLKKKRKKKFKHAYQAFFKLDSDIVDRCYNRYYQVYPARTNDSQRAEVVQFGQFLEETLAGIDALLPPYARDLVRYERLILSLSLTLEVEESEGKPGEEKRTLLLSDRLAVREGVDIEMFAYDVVVIHEQFLNDEQPQEVTRGQYTILFQKHSSAGSRFFSISNGTKALLDVCDGNKTLQEIVDQLQAQYGNPSLTNAILAMAHRMYELEVIEVRNP